MSCLPKYKGIVFNSMKELRNYLATAQDSGTTDLSPKEVSNPIDKNINKILSITTPSEVYPEEVQKQLHGLDVGDTFVIEYADGKFNLYSISPDVEVEIGSYVNKEGKLDFGAYDFKNFLGKYLVAEDISSEDIRTILRSSEAEEDFRENDTDAAPKEYIEQTIKKELPKEISDAVTVINDVPKDILGNPHLFFALKDILEDNGIKDELLINWLGINNNKLKIHPNTIKSEQQIQIFVENSYNTKKKVSSYPALQYNKLAKESFEKWVKALERFPLPFQDLMLSHAIKQLNKPDRRNKYVLQLSEVALTNTYGQVQNQPHKLNQVGKIYDKEVLATVSDAVGHEPSASGKGYWIHIPRTESVENREDILQQLKNIEGKEDIPDKTVIKWLIGGLDKTGGQVFETKKEAEETFANPTNPYMKENKHLFHVYSKEDIIRGTNYSEQRKKLEYRLTQVTQPNNSQFKVNIELLRKLSPSTWCTSGSMASHYVENYDNYLLVVDGVTVAGIEAYPEGTLPNEEEEKRQEILYDLEEELKVKERSIKEFSLIGDKEKEREINNIKKEIERLRNYKPTKIKVKEVTSRNNNGTASIDHLDDTIAFFKKHNLDEDNESLKAAINQRNKGKKDSDLRVGIEQEEEYHGEGWYNNEPPDQGEAYAEEDANMQDILDTNTVEDAITKLTDNPYATSHFQYFRPELKENERVATLAVENDPHNMIYINPTVDFYSRLLTKAVEQSPRIFEYLPQNIKEQREDLRKLYNDYLIAREAGINQNDLDDLPFSKTKDSRIQGYYDAKNDKVVVVANNTPVNEASKIAIHEVAHRGMLRMAKELDNGNQIQGINIYSKSTDKLGKRLTNPNWYAKDLMDVEAPYKANASKIKAPHLNKEEALKYDMNLMYKLQVQKFQKNPELIDEINERGGLQFILNSEHTVGVRNSRWEGKGTSSNFIKVLAKSYETVAKELNKFQENNKNAQNQLFQVLSNAESQLMKKLPELLKRTGHTSLEDLMLDYGFDSKTEEGKFKLLQELAARWAETFKDKPKESWWKELLQKIGDWIKKFTGRTLNEEEVNELVGGFVKYGANVSDETIDRYPKSYEQTQELFDSNPELANAVYSKILTNSGLSAENLLSLLLKDNLIEKQCS